MPTNPARCIAAARVSTDEQAQHGTSIESQIEAVHAYIERIGGEVVGSCIERGVSGALFETRAKLQAALEMLDHDEADAIVWYDITRMSRDIEFSTAIIRRIERAGKQALFCMATYADGADGFIARGVAGVLSHGERLKIRERTSQGSRRRAESGIMPSRSMRPLGYRFVTPDDVTAGTHTKDDIGKYLIVPDEADTIRLIFTEYASGATLGDVSRLLHERGIPTRRGASVWPLNTIRGILRNPLYKGLAAYGKAASRTDESRMAQGHKANYRTPRDSSEWLYFEAPAIIEPEMWDACQVRLSTNRALKSGRKQSHRLLSGLVRCRHCGYTKAFIGSVRRYERTTNRAPLGRYKAIGHYRCGRGHVRARCPYTGGDDAGKLHEAVIEILKAMLPHKALENAWKAFAATQKQAVKPSETTRLQSELRKLETRRAAIIEAELSALTEGRNPLPYRARLSELDASIERLSAKLSTLQASAAQAETVKQSSEPWRRAVSNILTVIESDTIAESDKNRVLQNLIHHITSDAQATVVDVYFNEHTAGWCYHAHLENNHVEVRVLSVGEMLESGQVGLDT